MIKLEKIITQLDEAVYENLENSLIRSRGDNFLFLLQAYRKKQLDDDKILSRLKLSSNSFYVLKSRLYDKIQEHLAGDIHVNREEVTRKLHRIPEMCFTTSREVATAYLLKLEKDLRHHDMHNELLVVYSALKQIHLFSDKYFHYSQLFNRHIAFSLSIEKCTEMLGNFNRVLGLYHFTRLPQHLETLVFLRKGIHDHYILQPSRQIEIIRNITDLQLELFCNITHSEMSGVELLHHTAKLLSDLPSSSQQKIWLNSLDYLYFEYYSRMGQKKLAADYFSTVDSNMGSLFLYTNICTTSYFLESRLIYLQAEKKTAQIHALDEADILFDAEDRHTRVMLAIHNALATYFDGRIKDATVQLHQLLNDHTFKEMLHVIAEIKLVLALFYLLMKDYNEAATILKNLQRKLKTGESDQYRQALYLIKLLNSIIREPSGAINRKQHEMLELFLAHNRTAYRMIPYLENEIQKLVTKPALNL